MKKLLLIICMPVLIFSSCTMEKRLYRPGHNIEWSHSNKKHEKINSKISQKTTAIEPEINPTLSASIDNSDIIIQPKFILRKNEDCDNIILKNGDEVKAKVTEVGTSEIKYKKCDNLNGPVYSIQKNEVFMIKYANGTKDVIQEVKEKGSDSFFDDDDYAIKNGDFKDQKPVVKRTEGIGIAGFIIVLASLPLWWYVAMIIGIVGSIMAIIFGIIGMARGFSKSDMFRGKGFSVISFILGIILLIISIALLAAVL